MADVPLPIATWFELLDTLLQDQVTQPFQANASPDQLDHCCKRYTRVAAETTEQGNHPLEPKDLLVWLRLPIRLNAGHGEFHRCLAELEQPACDRRADSQSSRLDIVARLAKIAESRDAETGYHVVRVAHFSHCIARGMGLSAETVEAIFVAAPLHDIGKLAIPDSILLKPDKLTKLERRIIQTHCIAGDRILDSILNHLLKPRIWCASTPTTTDKMQVAPVLATAREIVMSHHEWWDGSGYPLGLSGEGIPLAGRIVALADVYDALTTIRPYKPAFNQEETLALISEGVGRQFDPHVHASFLTALPEIERIRRRWSDRSFSQLQGVASSVEQSPVPSKSCR